MSLAAVSKHLKVLERAGLVEQGRTAQYRPRRLNPEPLKEVDDCSANTEGSGKSGSTGSITI